METKQEQRLTKLDRTDQMKEKYENGNLRRRLNTGENS